MPDTLPSCEDVGYNHHYRCTRCGKLFDDPEAEQEITLDDVTEPALGHQAMAAVKDEDSQTAPDCEHDGGYDMVVYCANCYSEMSREHVVLPALGHDWSLTYYWNTEDFSTVYGIARCNRCHTDIRSETVTPTSEIIKPATCTEKGEIRYSATFADPVFTPVSITQDIAPLGHSWNEPAYSWNDDYSKVTATRTCQNGNHPETETVSATGMETQAPTCEDEGVMTYTSQNFTNEAFTAQTTTQPIAALGHDWGSVTYTWSDGNESCTASRECNRDHSHVEQETVTAKITPVDPTCTEKGSNTYTAAFTNSAFEKQVRIVDVPALGHEEATRKENEVAATCTEAGSYDEVVYCSRCGVELSRTAKTVAALGHDFGEWKQTKAPSCEEAGTERRECSRCGEKETREIAALGHNWNEPTYSWKEDYSTCTATRTCKNGDHLETETVNTTEEVIAPTCKEDGKIIYTATFKNPAFETQTKTVKGERTTGHNLDGNTVEENRVEPTCTEDGGYDLVLYCTKCGQEISRTHKTIAKLGHNWSEWKQTKAPTCGEKGIEERECSRCHEKETRDIAALEHKYGDWKYDGESAKTHTRVCDNDPSHKETEPCQFDEGVVDGDITTYTCKVCGGTYTVKEEGPVTPVVSGITRVAGGNRFGTSFAISDTILMNSGNEKHDCVILANGDNFADALAGSYLA
ncbi:MAG: cell wall-binding repeat-containing protein, partial [Erysipelotrichaceae bacterium]|nr:cell wall-binding repeat-containing protein [Erysipelotrichaceae bacterium]